MGTENPEQRHETHEAKQPDELPIQDLVDAGEEASDKIRGGTDDQEANSEKIRRSV